ncbi:MAG: TonB-dependent receptor [Candidatus Pedobacter colombiensis]|uniref:TonB-dependent receptor n=1 Tax=Candidatus Pedobacter colombiensis TaxID=3121371 RepID=A0AAJ5WA21_9SPHI|nr:TonB-dependent receptor [Pedobacter sp.]WEK21593.1 MAG: TonB-dependent receptor [Pedobacter sp.]
MKKYFTIGLLFYAFVLNNTIISKAYAQAQSQQKTITILSKKKIGLSSIFKEISKQSGYSFIYSEDQIKDFYTDDLQISRLELVDALKYLERHFPVAFKVGERSISVVVVQKKQEQILIKGRVVGIDNAPIPGVSIKEKGSIQAVIADSDGYFKISTQNVQGILIFSYIGFKTIEQDFKGSTLSMMIKMTENENSLNEIVVVGYGSQKKINLTGAVSTIDVKSTLEGRPVADVGRALQGGAAGLRITIPSGEVGSDPIIKIRGQIGSLSGESSPLILLDNVEIPSIALVNPGDIESITILKDAAASSIYGAKAAFGVVLITTKQGTGKDKPQINYSGNLAFQNPWKELKMADVDGLKYAVDAAERVGKTSATGGYFLVNRESYERAVAWKEKYGNSIGLNDPTVYGRDWYVQNSSKMGVRTYDPFAAMVKEWAPTQQHNLSIGGTSGKTSYYLGLAALDQSGMMKPAKSDQFSRYNASLKVTSEISKYITARAGAIYSRRNKEYPYITSSTTADPWYYLFRWGPIYPLGNDENGDPIRSPASEAAAANTANILQNYMNFNLGSTINILKNWKADVDYTFSNQEEISNRPGTRYTGRDSWADPLKRLDKNGDPVYVNNEGKVVASTDPGAMLAYDMILSTYTAPGSNPDHFRRQSSNFYRHTINAYTTYKLDLDKNHHFKYILGLNRVTDKSADQYTQITNLLDITNPQFSYGSGTLTGGGGSYWEAQLGYFGRVNYSFKDKYLLEGNVRYDGSSKFPTNLKWRWFPSFSAGWLASDEKFMQWANPALSMLKFRASWGSIGDQTVSSSLYVPTMSTGQSNWIGINGKENYVGTPSAVSTSITWQDINTLNLGVDAGFFNRQLGVTFELFKRNTNNMIVPEEGVIATFGAGAPKGNFGSLETRGWELSVDFNHHFSNGLGINVRGNVSDAKSIITAYGTTKSINSNYVGRTVGEIWGYRTDRLYQMSDFELDANGKLQLITLTAAESKYAGQKAYKLKPGPNGEKPVYQVLLQNSTNFKFGPGDVKFVDVNGDGEINNGSSLLDDHGDLEVIGNSSPRYEYGLRLGADYKGFDFSVFFQGVAKRQIWGDGTLAIPGYRPSDGAMPAAIANNYWTPDHTGAFYPAAYDNNSDNISNNMQIQSRYLLDMSYLRVKNLTLGYSLPKSLLKKLSISTLRLYTSMENFLTLDHLKGLPIDPEVINGYSMWNSSNYNSGRTGTGTPAFKSVSFGAQLTF